MRRPAAGRRIRAQRCRWSCFLLDGSRDPLSGCGIDLSEASAQASHQVGDLLALRQPELVEEACSLGVAVLRGLELEDPVAGPQLEVQRQRSQQVLQRHVDALLIPQLAQAVACALFASPFGHGAQRRGWTFGGKGGLRRGGEGGFFPALRYVAHPLDGYPTPLGQKNPPRPADFPVRWAR